VLRGLLTACREWLLCGRREDGAAAGRVAWCPECRIRGASRCGGLAPTPTASSSSPARSPTATWVSCWISRSPSLHQSPAACWWSPPSPCCTSRSPQPDGLVLYELVTGHPDRAPRELVFLADPTVELRLAAADLDRGGHQPGSRPADRGGRLAARARQGPWALRGQFHQADRPGSLAGLMDLVAMMVALLPSGGAERYRDRWRGGLRQHKNSGLVR
jgi:hypothetical protein